MSFLPVVERELRVAARQRGTYTTRLWAVLLVGVIGGLVLVWHSMGGSPAGAGRALFLVLGGLLLGFCLLEGVRSTADALADERREGTLGLLFLTDLRGYDVVLGKLVAATLRAAYALLGALPILSLAVLLGGVSGGDFGRMAAALLCLLFLASATGLAGSAISGDGARAVWLSLGFLVVWLVGPWLVAHGLVMVSRPRPAAVVGALTPLPPVLRLVAGDPPNQRGSLWPGLLASGVLGTGLLAFASWRAPRLGADRVVPLGLRAETRPWRSLGRPAPERERCLDRDPARWLFQRQWRARFWVWAVLAIGTAGLLSTLWWSAGAGLTQGTAATVGTLLAWGIRLSLSAQLARLGAEARRSGLLELLFSTPLLPRQVMDGLFRATLDQWLGPLLLLVTCASFEFPGLFEGVGGGWDAAVRAGFGGVLLIATPLVDLLALGWASVWFGLSVGRPNPAAFRALLITQVMPMVLCCGGLRLFATPILAFYFFSRLHADLRRLASDPASRTRLV